MTIEKTSSAEGSLDTVGAPANLSLRGEAWGLRIPVESVSSQCENEELAAP
jgi:hypothetical protein